MLVDILCHGAGLRPAVSDPTIRLDLAALCNAADALAAALASRGVSPGDRVAVLIPDGAAFLAAFAGTAAARAAFIALPTDDEATAREALARFAPRLVLSTPDAPQSMRVAASALGVPLVTVAFDTLGVPLVDGEYVYESHGQVAEDDDVAFITLDGTLVRHGELVAAALAGAPERPRGRLAELGGLTAALGVLASGEELVLDGAVTAGAVA